MTTENKLRKEIYREARLAGLSTMASIATSDNVLARIPYVPRDFDVNRGHIDEIIREEIAITKTRVRDFGKLDADFSRSEKVED